jgi:hypothetical protein
MTSFDYPELQDQDELQSAHELRLLCRLAPGEEFGHIVLDAFAELTGDLTEEIDASSSVYQGLCSPQVVPGTDGLLVRVRFDFSVLGLGADDERTLAQGLVRWFSEEGDRIDAVFRFGDTRLLESNLSIAKELFSLEMSIRECITLLLLHESPGLSVEEHLSESSVKLQNPPGIADLRSTHAESSLFYMLFSDYSSANKFSQRLDANQIMTLASKAESFGDFQRSLRRSSVVNNELLDTFLAGLRDTMDPIEKVRNAVAHNRAVRTTAHGNYVMARERVGHLIEETIEQLMDGSS